VNRLMGATVVEVDLRWPDESERYAESIVVETTAGERLLLVAISLNDGTSVISWSDE
jgi:hypothetical protein